MKLSEEQAATIFRLMVQSMGDTLEGFNNIFGYVIVNVNQEGESVKEEVDKAVHEEFKSEIGNNFEAAIYSAEEWLELDDEDNLLAPPEDVIFEYVNLNESTLKEICPGAVLDNIVVGETVDEIVELFLREATTNRQVYFFKFSYSVDFWDITYNNFSDSLRDYMLTNSINMNRIESDSI